MIRVFNNNVYFGKGSRQGNEIEMKGSVEEFS